MPPLAPLPKETLLVYIVYIIIIIVCREWVNGGFLSILSKILG